jgi:hypothetical protein
MISSGAPHLVRAKTYRLPDGQIGEVGGSTEHYFHFLLGYLLPAVAEVRRRGLTEVHVTDCGPVMAPILSDVFDELKVRSVASAPPIGDFLELPAWDHKIVERTDFQDAVEALRAIAFKKNDCCSMGREKILLLERSPMPDFYAEGGQAQIKGYGVARRGFSNLSQVFYTLKCLGLSHHVYSPGQHSFWCQVRTFSGARAVSGIRGAEWANMVWANKTVSVRVVYPTVNENPFLTNFLEVLELTYQVKRIEEMFPKESTRELFLFVLGAKLKGTY